MVFYRVRRIRGKYYLIKEWYDPKAKRKRSRSLGPCIEIERIISMVRGVGFEPTQACAGGVPLLRQRILSPPPLSWLGHPRM